MDLSDLHSASRRQDRDSRPVEHLQDRLRNAKMYVAVLSNMQASITYRCARRRFKVGIAVCACAGAFFFFFFWQFRFGRTGPRFQKVDRPDLGESPEMPGKVDLGAVSRWHSDWRAIKPARWQQVKLLLAFSEIQFAIYLVGWELYRYRLFVSGYQFTKQVQGLNLSRNRMDPACIQSVAQHAG